MGLWFNALLLSCPSFLSQISNFHGKRRDKIVNLCPTLVEKVLYECSPFTRTNCCSSKLLSVIIFAHRWQPWVLFSWNLKHSPVAQTLHQAHLDVFYICNLNLHAAVWPGPGSTIKPDPTVRIETSYQVMERRGNVIISIAEVWMSASVASFLSWRAITERWMKVSELRRDI